MNCVRSKAESPARRLRSQGGLTLVELLVALVISAVIAIAAISALVVGRQGFSTVDAASQLRDNARFATDMLQRFGVQAGFDDFITATTDWERDKFGDLIDPPLASVGGFTNASPSPSAPTTAAVTRVGPGTVGFGSDVLILRYQVAETFPKSGTPDFSMIDCYGQPHKDAVDLPTTSGERQANVISVGVGVGGEPELTCSSLKFPNRTRSIVRGVENFQVLYGVDGVTANTAVSAARLNLTTNFLRADEMIVPSDPTGEKTNANWSRVRSLKIGMVLRGPLGSAQAAVAQTYYPFGKAAGSAVGVPGSALSATADPGTAFTPAADTRLRQAVTFTIHLRNEQAL